MKNDICPKVAEDIEYHVLFNKKNKCIYCIGSKSVDKYFFTDEKYLSAYIQIINLMNGKNSIEFISKVADEKQLNIDAYSVFKICLNSGLLINKDDEIDKENKKRFNEFEKLFKTLASFNINKLCCSFGKIPNIVYNMIIFFMLLISFIGVVLFVSNNSFINWNLIISDYKVLIYFGIISSVSAVLHELSHAIVAKRNDIDSNRLVIAIAYMSLAAYVRLPGIYFIKSNKRIKIWIAGVSMNLFLASISYIFMCYTVEPIKTFFLVGVISNISMIVGSLVPFYLSDGYFILATMCKVPNLRKNSIKNTISMFVNKSLKKEAIICTIYFVVCAIFLFVVFSNIIINLGTTIYMQCQNGATFFDILFNFSNVLLILLLGLLRKVILILISKIKKGKS